MLFRSREGEGEQRRRWNEGQEERSRCGGRHFLQENLFSAGYLCGSGRRKKVASGKANRVLSNYTNDGVLGIYLGAETIKGRRAADLQRFWDIIHLRESLQNASAACFAARLRKCSVTTPVLSFVGCTLIRMPQNKDQP